MKSLYKYPQNKFPYSELLQESLSRKSDPKLPEYELLDTGLKKFLIFFFFFIIFFFFLLFFFFFILIFFLKGIFDKNEYFDIFNEYCKESPNDILIKVHIFNRSENSANLHVLPQFFHRNWWMWGKLISFNSITYFIFLYFIFILFYLYLFLFIIFYYFYTIPIISLLNFFF